MNATAWATSWRPTMPPASNPMASTAGRTPTPAPTPTRVNWGRKRPEMVAGAIVPDVLFEAHSAALGLDFIVPLFFNS